MCCASFLTTTVIGVSSAAAVVASMHSRPSRLQRQTTEESSTRATATRVPAGYSRGFEARIANAGLRACDNASASSSRSSARSPFRSALCSRPPDSTSSYAYTKSRSGSGRLLNMYGTNVMEPLCVNCTCSPTQCFSTTPRPRCTPGTWRRSKVSANPVSRKPLSLTPYSRYIDAASPLQQCSDFTTLRSSSSARSVSGPTARNMFLFMCVSKTYTSGSCSPAPSASASPSTQACKSDMYDARPPNSPSRSITKGRSLRPRRRLCSRATAPVTCSSLAHSAGPFGASSYVGTLAAASHSASVVNTDCSSCRRRVTIFRRPSSSPRHSLGVEPLTRMLSIRMTIFRMALLTGSSTLSMPVCSRTKPLPATQSSSPAAINCAKNTVALCCSRAQCIDAVSSAPATLDRSP